MSDTRWPIVPLDEVITRSQDRIDLEPDGRYRQVTVRLWGKGVVLRDEVDGLDIAGTRRLRVRSGQLIVSRIDARNGAIGIVPGELDGAIVSNDFPSFDLDVTRLLPKYLGWLARTPRFVERCGAASEGTTNRIRLDEGRLLAIEIPLPPLNEQRRIAARFDRLTELGDDVAQLQRSVGLQLDALLGAHLNSIFGDPYRGVNGAEGRVRLAVLGDVVADVADGPHKTPTYVEDGVPFVTVLNITTGRVSFRTVKHISEADHREYQKRARAERGDVLITKDGTIGIPCYVDTDRDFSFFVSVALVKPRRELLDGRYLTWLLRAPYLQARMRERSRGDMIRHLVLREIRALLLPLPGLDRQRQIVEHLEAVRAMTNSFRRLHEGRTDQVAALLGGELIRFFS